MSETRLWKFPYQYRIKCYDYWHFKIEKWLLGLRMVAWDIVSFIWDRERDRFAKAVGLKEKEELKLGDLGVKSIGEKLNE